MATAGNLGTGTLRIIANATALNKGLGAASARIKKFGNNVRQVGSSFTQIGTQAAATAAAIAAAFAPIVKVGAQFEQTLAIVKAVTGETGEAFDSIAAKARQLGEETRFTATEAAKAMVQLGRAGLDASEIVATTANVLSLASVGMIDLATAAGITTRIMRAFNLTAEESARIVDVLTVASNNANTTVELLGESFKFAAPTAASVGISFEETAAALGVLANAGLRGTLAGTALNQALLQLGKGTEKSEEVLARFGLTLADVDPRLNTLSEIIATLGNTSIDAIGLVEAFGIRGGRALSALVNQGAGALDIFILKVNESNNAAARAAATIEDTFLGRVRRLRSVFESLRIDIFDIMAADANSLVEILTSVIERVREWVGANKELVKQYIDIAAKVGVIAAMVAAIGIPTGILISALGSLLTIIGPIVSGIAGIGKVIFSAAVAAEGLGATLAAAAGPAAILIAALFVIIRNFQRIGAAVGRAFVAIGKIFAVVGKSLMTVFKIVEPLVAIVEEIIVVIIELASLIIELFGAVIEIFSDLATNIVDALDSVIPFKAFWKTMVTGIKSFGKVVGSVFSAASKGIKRGTRAASDFTRSILGLETATEKEARVAEARRMEQARLNTELEKALPLMQKVADETSGFAVLQQRILGIQEKGRKASVAELKILQQLIEQRNALDTSNTKQLAAAQTQLRLNSQLQLARVGNEKALKRLRIERDILTNSVKSLTAAIEREKDVTAEQGDALIDSIQKTEDQIAAKKLAIVFENELKAARENAKGVIKELAKIEAELADARLTENERFLKQLNDRQIALDNLFKRKKEQVAFEIAEASRQIQAARDSKVLAKSQEVDAQKRLDILKKERTLSQTAGDTEKTAAIQKKIGTFASLVTTAKKDQQQATEKVANAQGILNSFMETAVALEERRAKATKDTTELVESRVLEKNAKINIELDRRKLVLAKEQTKTNKDRMAGLIAGQKIEMQLLRLRQTEQVKEQELNLSKIKTENISQKALADIERTRHNQRKARIEEIKALQIKQGVEAVALAKTIRDEALKARDKELKKDRKEELSLEQKLVGELGKKVQSLRDLLALEKALAAIQERRVKRVEEQAQKARKAEAEIARIQKVLNDGRVAGVKLGERDQLRGEQTVKALKEQLATARQFEAFLRNRAGLKEPIKPPDEEAQQKLDEFLTKAIEGIKVFSEKAQNAFADIGTMVVQTFDNAFSNILSGFCKLLEDMKAKAAAAAPAITAAATGVNPAVSVAGAVGNFGAAGDPGGAPVGGGAGETAAAGANRTTTINVNNNVDSDILLRDIGSAVGSSFDDAVGV